MSKSKAVIFLWPLAMWISVCIGLPGCENASQQRFAEGIGHAASTTAIEIFDEKHAEVLSYGLNDVSGIAAGMGFVYVQQADDPVLVLEDNGGETAWKYCAGGTCAESPRTVCPEGHCNEHSPFGVLATTSAIFYAQDGGLFTTKALEGSEIPLAFAETRLNPAKMGSLARPIGISGTDSALVVTADPDFDDPTKEHASRGQLLLLRTRYVEGDRKAVVFPEIKVAASVEGLTHPSGIVSLGDMGPAYVVEDLGDKLQWSVYGVREARWIREKILGRVAKPHSFGKFFGLASPSRENEGRGRIFFAAGPDGLYLFNASGREYGRLFLGQPVTGVAYWGKAVYFASGHLLGRIRLNPKFLDIYFGPAPIPLEHPQLNLLLQPGRTISTISPSVKPHPGVRSRARRRCSCECRDRECIH